MCVCSYQAVVLSTLATEDICRAVINSVPGGSFVSNNLLAKAKVLSSEEKEVV